MTNKTAEVMAYILTTYPKNILDEMSNARLTKMVYLSDWRASLKRGKRITEISWYFDNYGPFVNDIEKTAKANKDRFKIDYCTNMHGQPKKVFRLKKNSESVNLSSKEKEDIDFVISKTKSLYWREFIKLVYSTFPIASSEKYSNIDLIAKAEEYKASRN